jgi:hypothetical protein
VATASKTEVTVGETFIVEVKASGPEGTEFIFPAEIVADSIELRAAAPSASAPAVSAPPPAGTHRYQAAVFALGETRVPPVAVGYRLPDGTRGEAHTAPIGLRVGSLLPKSEEERKLADIRGPVGLPVGAAFWIGLVALALILAGATYWIAKRLRRKPVAAPVAAAPPLEPDEDARRALDALVASGLLARGEYRLFYIELTAIAKRYLERRLAAPIVEMTTAEMLAHLRSTPHGVELAPTLRDLSGAADQIKFARGRGLENEAARHLAAVRGLIDGLETRLRPAAPEGGKAA